MKNNLILRDSFFPFSNLHQDFERFFNTFNDLDNNLQQPTHNFKLDFTESDQQYELKADIPGVNKENILVEENEGMLKISVERKSESKEEDKEKNYLKKEISYGKYERLLKIPDNSDFEKITAKYEKGVLNIIIPKKEVVKEIKKIEVS